MLSGIGDGVKTPLCERRFFSTVTQMVAGDSLAI